VLFAPPRGRGGQVPRRARLAYPGAALRIVTRPTSLPLMTPLSPLARRLPLLAIGAGALVLTGGALLVHHWLAGPSVLFAPQFATGTTTLVTNEFATYNPRASGSRRSPNWIVTSGSLFARDGAGWTGAPDDREPDASSASGTGSSVFRVVSRRADFGDVSIRMRLRVDRMQAAIPQNWDGVHVFARYQSPVRLYVVSVARRDGNVVVKKKVPGNSSNGGTYIQLGPTVSFPLDLNAWHDVRLDVRGAGDAVRLVLHLDNQLALDVVDKGEGGPPITTPGRVGLRGDKAEFDFDRFSVRSE
jgi:hypothetical protein